MGWIDYRKAFDSVPHSWLIEVLDVYKINPSLIGALKHLMSSWQTSLLVGNAKNSYSVDGINVNRGIFQGDSLSPLWFCLALNPLSRMLNKSTHGYALSKQFKLSHLFYMDDLKVYASSREQLRGSFEIVAAFSEAIKMEFGLDKCAIVHAERGKMVASENMELLDGTEISTLPPGETYRYLGMQQALNTDEKGGKEVTRTEMLRRVKILLKTKLNSKNKINALNTWAIPVMSYTFGVLHWSNTDIRGLDRVIRTTLTRFRMHHPKAALERLYLPRKDGGRGLIHLESLYAEQVVELTGYFKNHNNPLFQHIPLSLSPLNIAEEENEPEGRTISQLKEQWRRKELHGRFFNSLNQEEADRQASVAYLTAGYLFPETEGFLCAIQDQVMPTRTYRKYILKENLPTTKCRLCNREEESIQHILSACSYLAPTWYLERHNNVAKIIHQELCLKFKILKTMCEYYKYEPKQVEENDEVKLYWDLPIITDRTVQNNRPDIVVWHKRKKSVFLIDITIPLDDNIAKAYRGKICKYEPLAEELTRIWRVEQVRTLPLVISANGLFHRKLRDSLEEMGLQPKSLYVKLQKPVVLGTTSIVRKTLSR